MKKFLVCISQPFRLDACSSAVQLRWSSAVGPLAPWHREQSSV
jgi:hypothetical protein